MSGTPAGCHVPCGTSGNPGHGQAPATPGPASSFSTTRIATPWRRRSRRPRSRRTGSKPRLGQKRHCRSLAPLRAGAPGSVSARPCRRKLTLPWSSKTRGGRPRSRMGQQACCQGCRGPPLGRLTATSKRLEVAQKEPLYSGTCSVVNHRSFVKYRRKHSIPL